MYAMTTTYTPRPTSDLVFLIMCCVAPSTCYYYFSLEIRQQLETCHPVPLRSRPFKPHCYRQKVVMLLDM